MIRASVRAARLWTVYTIKRKLAHAGQSGATIALDGNFQAELWAAKRSSVSHAFAVYYLGRACLALIPPRPRA